MAFACAALVVAAAVLRVPRLEGTAFVLSVVFVGNVIGPAGVGFTAQHGACELAWDVGAAVLATRQASRPVAS